MYYTEPVRIVVRPTRSAVFAALAAASVLLIGFAIVRLLASDADGGSGIDPSTVIIGTDTARPESDASQPQGRGGRRVAGGHDGGDVVPDGLSVFDDDHATVTNLDPDLLEALRAAASDAAAEGVTFVVNSGWRSPEHQQELFEKAVAEYGSVEEAARWVATPDNSAHVSGDAVDIGPPPSAAWLSEHGAAYGLCQTYRNEPWHFELRTDAPDRGCPPMYADPTEDPRMVQ